MASKRGHSFQFRQADIAALIGRKPRIFCSAVMPRVASDSVLMEILMSASTGTTSSASVYTTPAFRERLWRAAGIRSVLCFIVAYIVYDHQPQVGASADALADFYDGDRMRILVAAVFYSLAVLNPMWFERRSGRPGGCGTRRLARGGDRLQCRPRSAFPLAHRGGRSPRVLHRRLGKSHAHIGPERLRGQASC